MRKFESGEFEFTVKPVKPSQERAVDPVPLHLMLPKDRTPEEQAERDEENTVRARRRAVRQVRYLCKALGADHLATLTSREVIDDLSKIKKVFDRFRRSVADRFPNWRYVCAYEKQERGAWHLHLAVKGRQDVNFLRRCWYRALGGTGDEKGQESPGACNVRGPRRRWGADGAKWRAARLASYIAKYIGKELDDREQRSGAKSYWVSRGIATPEPVRVWLPARTVLDAIQDAVKVAVAHGVREAWSVWLSQDQMCLQVSGRWWEPEIPF